MDEYFNSNINLEVFFLTLIIPLAYSVQISFTELSE